MKIWYVYSTYAGGTSAGSVRGVYGSRARAIRERNLLDATLAADPNSQNVVCAVTSTSTPRHPATRERIQLYI